MQMMIITRERKGFDIFNSILHQSMVTILKVGKTGIHGDIMLLFGEGHSRSGTDGERTQMES